MRTATRHGMSRVADEAATRYLYWWLLLAIFFEYARPGSFLPVINSLKLQSLIPLSLVATCIIAAGLRPMRDIYCDPIAKWILMYFGVIALSLVHAEVTLYAFEVTKTVLGYLLLMFAIVRVCTTADRIRGVAAVLILAHLFLLAMNPAAVLNPEQRNYLIGGTFLGDGNDFALSICIVLPMSIELALHSTSRIRSLLWWGSFMLLVLAVIATQSRGGTLGLAAVGGYLWLRSPRKILTLAAAFIAVAVMLAYAPEQYFSRMHTLTNYTADGSAMGRIMAWKAAIHMFLDHPLLGVGAGMFPVSFGTDYRPAGAENIPWLTAHSMYFLVLGEMALPGIVVLLGVIVENLAANRRLVRSRVLTPDKRDGRAFPSGTRRLLYLLSASMVGFATAGAFLSVAYYPHIFVLSGLMLATRRFAAAEQEAVPAEIDGRSPALAKGHGRKRHARNDPGRIGPGIARRRPIPISIRLR